MSIQLWVDRYMPQTLDEYVWRDINMRRKCEEWISEGALPHLCLSGKPGLGKTSLAKLLLKLLGVPKGDILYVKASRERKIEDFEARILGFIQTYPMIDNEHGIKYVLLDEADALTMLSQKFLRSEIEAYSSTVRFIMTCNYIEKIQPAILSRFQKFHFEALDQENFIIRVSEVLDAEKVEYSLDVLVEYIEAAYPDLRSCIGIIEQNTIGGKLQAKPKADKISKDYMFAAIDHFKAHRHTQAREMIVSQASVEEYPDVFRWLYNHLDLWGEQDQQDDALVIIRDGLYKSQFVADQEINLSATICELTRLSRK